jgi:hypothetical protein
MDGIAGNASLLDVFSYAIIYLESVSKCETNCMDGAASVYDLRHETFKNGFLL